MGNNMRGQNANSTQNKEKKDKLSYPNLKDYTEYINTAYLNDGKYDGRFIVEFAQVVSRMLTGIGYYIEKDENKSSQIRKYYEFARRVETSLKTNQMNYEEAVLELNRLRYQVVYARERKKVSRCFVSFIEINLNKIHNISDLYFFMKHFEAVIGYSRERK